VLDARRGAAPLSSHAGRREIGSTPEAEKSQIRGILECDVKSCFRLSERR
jgi:hypothetical protein